MSEELMGLADSWDRIARADRHDGDEFTANRVETCAEELRALLAQPEAAGALAGDGHVAMLRSLRLMYDDGVMEAEDHPGTVAALDAAIAALSAAPVAAQQPAVVGDAWQSIHDLPESDDLFWFARRDGDIFEVDGPREPSSAGYDAEKWEWFAPCKWPTLTTLTPAATPVPVGGEGGDCAEDCKRGFDHPLHCSLAQQGPVVDEPTARMWTAGGAVVRQWRDKELSASVNDVAVLVYRAMRAAALAHPPQDGRKGEEG